MVGICHTRARWPGPATGGTDQAESGMQRNRTHEPAVARQDRRRSARRPSLDRAKLAAPEVVSAATVGCRSMPWNRSPISYGGFGKGAGPRPILRLRLWPKTVIDRVWPILSCRPTIKTGTAGVRATWMLAPRASLSPCEQRQRAKPAGAFVRSAADGHETDAPDDA